MNRSTRFKLPSVILGAVALAACGGGDGSSGSSGPSGSTSTAQSTVNFVVTDSPSTAITVLSFQMQITGAVLQPGNISILPRPITVDLAQLASDTGLLASSVIDSATYTSLTLTYANPQVSLQNNTGGTLTLNGQSCMAGATCTFTPALNNASVTISSGVFPLTVTASSTTGLKMDLSIPDLLQSDLSVTFANGNSVNLSLLPDAPLRIDDVLATVTAVSGSAISVTTAFGDQLVLNAGGTATYQYPGSQCSSASMACVMVGQEVALDATLGTDGTLDLDALSYVGASGSSLVRALVLAAPTGSAPAVELLLLRGLNMGVLSPGQLANATLAAGAEYSVASAGYPVVPSASFAGPADLIPGQVLIVGVGADVMAGSIATFTASGVFLDSSQLLGDVSSLTSSTTSFAVDSLAGLFTASGLHIESIDVQTSSATTYVGASGFAALAPGQVIVAKGPLFNVPGGVAPALAAQQVNIK